MRGAIFPRNPTNGVATLRMKAFMFQSRNGPEIPDGMHDLFLSAPAAREKAYKKMFSWLKKRTSP
mgnify:CR=1 FL=1